MADGKTRRGPLRAIVALSFVFVLGMVCGAAIFFLGQHAVAHRHTLRPGDIPHAPNGAIKHLMDVLELDEEQRETVAGILRTSHGEARTLMESTHTRLLDVLTPKQREKFEGLHPMRRHKRRHGPRPHEQENKQ